MSSTVSYAPEFPDSIFRAYDIRGIVGETLTGETAYWLGRAVGAQSLAQGEARFRTVAQKLHADVVAALRAAEGVSFARSPFEVVPPQELAAIFSPT